MTLYADECPADICRPGNYFCIAIVSFNDDRQSLKLLNVAFGYIRKTQKLLHLMNNDVGPFNGRNFLWSSLLGYTLTLFSKKYRPTMIDLYHDPKTMTGDLREASREATKEIIEQLAAEHFGDRLDISSVHEGNKGMFGISIADNLVRGLHRKLENDGYLIDDRFMAVKDFTDAFEKIIDVPNFYLVTLPAAKLRGRVELA